MILINGPARSGKDTLALAMWKDRGSKQHRYRIHKFAGIMHEFWGNVFEIMLDPTEWDEHMNGSKKSTEHPELGISYRQGMIGLSEDFIKPLLGKAFFGRFTAAEIDRAADNSPIPYVALISDSGFAEEAVAVIEKFGAENVLHVKLYRAGYTFAGDSRNYIDLEPFGVEVAELENVTIEQFERDGIQIIREFVERK